MNELKIINTIPATIKWDKETALKEAKEIMAKYDGVEFTESQLPNAKKELATLRKVSKEINSQALAIDKELSIEIKEFRSDVKEVKAIVDKGVSFIDEQVKTFEQKQKDERKVEIMTLDLYDDIKDYVEFDNDWLLKKWTDEKLVLLFKESAEQIKSNINSIKMLATSHDMESDRYVEKLKSMPLDLVLNHIVEDAQLVNVVDPEKVVEVKVDTTQPTQTITRHLTGTIQALTMLKEYADKIGIGWSK